MFGAVGGYGCGYSDGALGDGDGGQEDNGGRSEVDMVGQLFFKQMEFYCLGAVAGAGGRLFFAAAVRAGRSRSTMAKYGEIGGKSHQQQPCYPTYFSRVWHLIYKGNKEL